MTLQGDGQAPYAPAAAVLLVVDRFRQRGLQTPFTGEVLAKAGVSDSLVKRTLQALRLLGLVDPDGHASQAFNDYARAPEDEAKQRFADIVRKAYAPVFSFVDPLQDPPERVRDAFRSFEPRGQQERMVSLFLGLCEHAGLVAESPKRLSAPRPARPSVSQVRRRERATGGKASDSPGQVDKQKDAGTGGWGLPDAVEGMLRELAAIGPTWTRERRDAFMQAWAAVVDFSFPVAGDGTPPYDAGYTDVGDP